MIEFECPKCDRRQRFDDHMAGTDFRCGCGALLEIPSLTDFDVVDNDGPSANEAFGTPIEASDKATVVLGGEQVAPTVPVDRRGQPQFDDHDHDHDNDHRGGDRFARKKASNSQNSDYKDACSYAMLTHLAAYSTFLIPSGSILGPLVVWLIYREQFDFVDDHGKEALNFQISTLLYAFGLAITVVGILLIPVLIIFALIMPAIAGMKANEGKDYQYPLTIRFIK